MGFLIDMFQSILTSTINAKCATNPWQYHLLGTAEAPDSHSISGALPCSVVSHCALHYRGTEDMETPQ